jgi:hypothetical protein
MEPLSHDSRFHEPARVGKSLRRTSLEREGWRSPPTRGHNLSWSETPSVQPSHAPTHGWGSVTCGGVSGGWDDSRGKGAEPGPEGCANLGFTPRPGNTRGANRPGGLADLPRRAPRRQWTAAAVPQVGPTRALGVVVDGCTSRQSDTHRIESREVRYPWHPWYGRIVGIDRVVVRGGRAVFQCRLEPGQAQRSVEVREWMFDAASCLRMRLGPIPSVSCDTLRDLQAMLHTLRSRFGTICATLSTRPITAEEVLMRPSPRSSRVPQLSLFHPPSPSPHWATFPREVREQAVRWLARLLRKHQNGVGAAGRSPETGHE